MFPSAPRFKKVIILLSEERMVHGTLVTNHKVEHEDCSMILTGNHIIITEQETGDADNPETVTGVVYDLKEVDSYKIFKN
jgi:hypothetical protein